MSPRPRQNFMTKVTTCERGTRKSVPQSVSTCAPGIELMHSTLFTGGSPEYLSRPRSETLHSDESLAWSGSFPGHFSGHDDAQFDSLHMDTMPMPDTTFMMPVIPGSHCYNAPMFDQFTQEPLSQTLTGPLLESSYPDTMMGDDIMHISPSSMELQGYAQALQHIWRHGLPSPPAEDVNTNLHDHSTDPACDMSFQVLPDSAIPGTLAYDKTSASASRHSQPRPIRSASERNSLNQTTMAPQDIHYSRNDRADKVKARNDPRYDIGPDKDGYYHCPMLCDGSCNHKPTKQKCIYAKYLDSHLKPYVCTHGEKGSECDGARFSSNACLFRHEREAHGMHNHGLNPYLCLFPGCERSRQGNGFPRRWNQRDHMKRVHDWEEPETAGSDNQDRHGPMESVKRRKSGHSHTVPMKRSSSSHAKAQAATYAHGSRHNVSMSRYATQAEKQAQASIVAYPMQFNDVQYSQVPAYHQQPRTSEAYPNNYLVAL